MHSSGQPAVGHNPLVLSLMADDLTGASDAAVQFARRGLTTRVLFDLTSAQQAEGVEALAVDSDTRQLPADAAAVRVRRLARHVAAARPTHVYKKIDSTLRGNLGAELDAIMDVFDFRLAIVAPAFPALGRTTRAGLHYLRGTPVHLTEIAHDPHAPVHESDVLRRLAEGSRRTPGLIPLELVERGREAIRERADQLMADGASLLVCDAESAAALGTIAATFAADHDLVWVGSAGLAEVLPEALGLPRRAPRPAGAAPAEGPVLIVAGSLSEVTRR
ncbi:MAG: four-carbon acid sugar kinase family protein, partial [Chloroflexi bacterium]|nr:four-carbon acid sugar kinase family protein [Chloroflexota bacterium]